MKRKRRPVIVGIGELLWDMLPTGKKVGGAPINFAYHSAISGADSYAISAVGNDYLGNEIINITKGLGINLNIEKVDYPTGIVKVELKNGIPSYSIIENVAWDYIPFTPSLSKIARNTDVVCFGTLAQRSETSRGTIQSFLSFVPDESFRILDINLRAPFYSYHLVEESVKRCNILKLNIEELEILKKMFPISKTDISKACKWLIDTYCLKYLILTSGADYSMVFAPEAISFLKTPQVKVVDTVGAGDSFTAAFITSLLMGATLEEAHNIAVDRAAEVCSFSGAWSIEI